MGLFDFFKKKDKPPIAPKKSLPVEQSRVVQTTTPLVKITTEIVPSPTEEIVPVSKRVKTAAKSSQGLYPHEILVLDYAHTFYTERNSFQGFWWYQYGVNNVTEVLQSLLERGFLKIGGLQSAIEKDTVAGIKDILKSHNLKVSGKKSELVQRLLDSVPIDELNSRFVKRTYQLTDLGSKAIEEEAYIPYIHRHAMEDLDIWSLNKIVHTPPIMHYRDKIWEYLNQRSMEHAAAQNFGLYRNCRYHMHLFLLDECKYKDALGMLSEVVFFDLSGLWNGYSPEYLEIFAKSFFPYKDSTATMAPAITDSIMRCQKELGLSDDELKAAMVECMHKLSAPLQLFTAEECVDIVLMESKEDKESLTKIYAKAKRRFKEKYPGVLQK